MIWRRESRWRNRGDNDVKGEVKRNVSGRDYFNIFLFILFMSKAPLTGKIPHRGQASN